MPSGSQDSGLQDMVCASRVLDGNEEGITMTPEEFDQELIASLKAENITLQAIVDWFEEYHPIEYETAIKALNKEHHGSNITGTRETD